MRNKVGAGHYDASNRIALIAAVVAMFVGALALTGWMLDMPRLRAPIPGQVSIKVNSALGFLASGALLSVAQVRSSLLATISRWTLAILLFVGAALTLMQYLLAVDFGIDQLFLQASDDSILTGSPGRMAPTTAIGFIMIALAIAVDHWENGVARGTSRTLATLLLLVATASLLGYVYRAPVFYLAVDGMTAMSLPTSVLFVVLALGIIWLRYEFGLTAMMAERSIVGTHIRSLLPMVIAVPILVGVAVISGLDKIYDGRSAIALVAIGSVVASSIVAALSIVMLRRTDKALGVKDLALDSATSGVLITDHKAADEPIVYVNRAFCMITGFQISEVLGKNCRFLNHGIDNEPAAMTTVRTCITTEQSCAVEIRNRRKDGTVFWNRLTLAPVPDYEGDVTHYVGIIDDITESREQEARLTNALDEAHEIAESRDKFVRMIGHELRTPLNAALTWIRLMEVDDQKATREKGMRVVAQSIDSQSRLIDDLVDVTRFASVGVSLESEPVNVRELLSNTIDEMRPGIEASKTLSVVMEDGDYTAVLDPLRVQQILRNLLSNADKYTPDEGRVDVHTGVDGAEIVFSVSDSGVGMSAVELEKMFDAYWRAKSERPGLGIGLYIVKSLVDEHGGSITATSAGKGQGTRFEVRLPRDASPSGHASLDTEQPIGQRVETRGVPSN